MADVIVKKPSLVSAIAIGVGTIIGSGWLFAAYYTAKIAGTMSILAWIIGCVLVSLIAVLLGEIATMYHDRGLFSRLMTISHNRDIGFVFAISNLLGTMAVIPSEAAATVQYLTSVLPERYQEIVYPSHELSLVGIAGVALLVVFYAFVNYWGLRVMAGVNNFITGIKLLIPTITALILLYVSFHPGNFSVSYAHFSWGGLQVAFNAVVAGGIFYAFFGFNNIALFASELDNPKRNIPLALLSSIFIALLIYLLLQVAFMGAVPSSLLAHGWQGLNFSSPLAQLLIVLNVNVWAIVLYADSALSPSGTGIVYMGSGTRNLTAMSQEKQLPSFFNKVHPFYRVSRRSLAFFTVMCLVIICFFKSWQQIMMLTTAFQLLTCLAVPITFAQLRRKSPEKERTFKVPAGKFLSLLAFMMVAYFMFQLELKAIVVSTVVHVIVFVTYCLSYYRGQMDKVMQAFKSSFTVFVFMLFVTLIKCGYLYWSVFINNPVLFYVVFIVLAIILYFVLLNQKNYVKDA